MRVVLDTNVLVSAILFGGKPASLIRLIEEDLCASVTSSPSLDELRRVLMLKFHYPPPVADAVVSEWQTLSEEVNPTEPLHIITQDPSDNRVLECALAGHVHAIVSGDRHLLTLQAFRGIPILTPQAFLKRLSHTTD